MKYEQAEQLAIEWIKGTRKGLDKPRFIHSIEVGKLLKKDFDIDVQIAGVLHDIIEDSDMTIKELKSLGCSNKTIKLVDLATHDEKVKYKDHKWLLMIARIIEEQNTEALAIKLADVFNNYHDRSGLPEDRKEMMETKLHFIYNLSKPVLSHTKLFKLISKEYGTTKKR